MKLTVFQSDKGDCTLVTGADGKLMLADGGMGVSYTAHVAPHLNALRLQDKKLDLVYLSHIDDDHIGGILRMLDDEVDWRVHEHMLKTGNMAHKPPTSKRPPVISNIWHNAFHELVGQNAGAIENMLAASAVALSGTTNAQIEQVALSQSNLANSTAQALKLARRVGIDQLKIPLNKPASGKLMFVRETKRAIKLGGMSLFIIGPFKEDLEILRNDWNKWLNENADALKKIQQQAKTDAHDIADEVERIIQPLLAQAKAMGNRSKVTPPNLASLMLLVTEGKKNLLLTGDGHADDILKGLAHYGKFDASGKLKVDVLKVQHHGAEHNIHEEFCRRIIAANYVFCGNGFMTNPETDVIDLIVKTRLKEPGNFKLWFNSNSGIPGMNADNVEQMKKVEAWVGKLVAQNSKRLKASFMEGNNDKFELEI
jgi:beta-lactamase superfamily II metal-dependent hydrolase